MKFVDTINSARANHFFEKKNNDELLVAFGFNYEDNIPLNDFKVYNVNTNLC